MANMSLQIRFSFRLGHNAAGVDVNMMYHRLPTTHYHGVHAFGECHANILITIVRMIYVDFLDF